MLNKENKKALELGKNDEVNEYDEWYSNIMYFSQNISGFNHLINHKKERIA